MKGSDVDMIDILSKKLGFRYQFKRERYQTKRLENGTWIGTMGSVAAGISVLGIGHIVVDYNPRMPGYSCLKN